jgi:DNA repair exonuclease SbcCD ATPase subunit
MTFEEMERTMQFILEQQAQLTVKQSVAEERVTRLEEAQAGAARQIEHLGRRMEQLAAGTAERFEQLGERIENLAATTDQRIEHLAATTARQIDHLGAAMVELTKAHMRTEATVARLAEAQAHGERKLDALIDFVRGSKDGGS